MRVSTWALRLLDRLILQTYVPLAVVGYYSLGYMLGGTLFELIASSVNSAILPFFYSTAVERSEAASKRIFADVAAYNAALLAFLGLGTILFAREVILVLATPQYLVAQTVVPFVAWASLFQALANVPNRSIYLAKKTTALPVITGVAAAINIGLNLVLIPRYGMLGAAWATLVAYPVLFALTLWLAQRVYPIPYDYWRMAKPLVIMLPLSLLAGAISLDSIMTSVALKLLVLGAFPVALVASGFLTDRDRRMLADLAGRALPWAARRSRELA